jgi:hypothetical protein
MSNSEGRGQKCQHLSGDLRGSDQMRNRACVIA